MPDLKLGLIGDNIAPSRAPLLHRLAGRQSGLEVAYELLVPAALGKSVEDILADCVAAGYRGVNVTLPYKERAAGLARVDDPPTRRLGAINTIVFEASGPVGFNTDYSGFVAAYRAMRGDRPPGPVCQIGAGGVGRAVAFGLVKLGVERLHLVDRDRAKAEALAGALQRAAPELEVRADMDAEAAARAASGLLNCTPVGMIGYGGTPLAGAAMIAAAGAGANWAFDAVYTPVDTQFLADAAAAGLQVIPGYELFFHQGVDAWARFGGRPLDLAKLRADLAAA